jgi:hypothetical protein
VAYKLVQLAVGSYDLELDGEPIASVVASPRATGLGSGPWYVEVLDEARTLAAPFTDVAHKFTTFRDVQEWLGNPETVAINKGRRTSVRREPVRSAQPAGGTRHLPS